MESIDLRFQGCERVITSWLVDGVLVDPGPESCLDTLLAALGEIRPRAILLTHIHFDHAGATGALIARWPEVPVFVHDRGAPHMASPERLLASTARLIGEDGIRSRWGGMAPVPEENLHVLTGGERVLDGAFRVEYTPGHAIHHVAYLHEESGWAMVGDLAGVRIVPETTVVAPTPPPDVDLTAWPDSLRKLREWGPRQLCLSHSGAVSDTSAHLDALEETLALQAERAASLDADAFAGWYRGHLGDRMTPDVRELYLEASPVEHMWRGLRRWHEKRARRAAGA